MRETVTTADGRVFVLPSEEEDKRITAAALADPDALPVTEEEWRLNQQRLKRYELTKVPAPPVKPSVPDT